MNKDSKFWLDEVDASLNSRLIASVQASRCCDEATFGNARSRRLFASKANHISSSVALTAEMSSIGTMSRWLGRARTFFNSTECFTQASTPGSWWARSQTANPKLARCSVAQTWQYRYFGGRVKLSVLGCHVDHPSFESGGNAKYFAYKTSFIKGRAAGRSESLSGIEDRSNVEPPCQFKLTKYPAFKELVSSEDPKAATQNLDSEANPLSANQRPTTL